MNLTCPKCGGRNQTENPDSFVKCGFCNSALFIDIDGIAEVYSFTPGVQADQLGMYLKRDFEKTGFNESIEIREAHPVYFPFWQVESSLELRRACSAFPENFLAVPSGTRVFFNAEQAMEKNQEIFSIDTQPAEDKTRTLYYLPFFHVSILFNKQAYTFFINAVNGEVYGEPIPYISSEKTYRLFPLFISVFLVLILINAIFDDMTVVMPLTLLSLYLFYQASLRMLGKRYYRQ